MGYNGNLNNVVTDVITTQGDLRRGDSSGNAERLAIGSANQVLQSNGTTESWATLSASGLETVTTVSTLLSSTFTTVSATADELGAGAFRLTLPTITGGKCLVVCSGTWERSTSGGAWGQLYTDELGSDAQIYGTARASEFEVDAVVPRYCYSSNCIVDALGQDISVYVLTGGGTLTCSGSGSSGNSWCMSAIGVG